MTEQLMNSLPYVSSGLIFLGAIGFGATFGLFGKKKGPKGGTPSEGTPIPEPSGGYVTEDAPPLDPAVPAEAEPLQQQHSPEFDEPAPPLDEDGEPVTLPGLPLLGVIPSLSARERGLGYLPLLSRQPADSVQAAEYRNVWDRLGVGPKDSDEAGGAVRVLAVTGAQAGEGVSVATANLAAAAARLGYSVLVVDADLADPAQHLLLGAPWTPGAPGLGDVLTRAPGVPAPEVLARPTAIPGVRLIPAGSFPVGANGAALFASPHAARFVLSQAPALADIVLFDTPPLFGGGPGVQVVAQTSGVILVVDTDRREASRVRQTLRSLEREGASMLGGLVVPAPITPEGGHASLAHPTPVTATVEETATFVPGSAPPPGVDTAPAADPFAIPSESIEEEEETGAEALSEPAADEYDIDSLSGEDEEEEAVEETDIAVSLDAAATEAEAEIEEEEEEPQTVESVRDAMAAAAAPPPPPAEPARPLFLSSPTPGSGSGSRRGKTGAETGTGDARKVLDTISEERITPMYDLGRRAGNALAASGFAFSSAPDEDEEEEEETPTAAESSAETAEAAPVSTAAAEEEEKPALPTESEDEEEEVTPPIADVEAVPEEARPDADAPADAESESAPAEIALPQENTSADVFTVTEDEVLPVEPAVEIEPATTTAPELLPSAPAAMPVRKPEVMLEVLATPDAGMTLRATTIPVHPPVTEETAGAVARKAPRVLLEISTKPGEVMSMRAGTPNNGGLDAAASSDPNSPDVLLETTTRYEAPDAATMRLLVMEDAGVAPPPGGGAAPTGSTVLEASLQKPEAMTIRSGQSGDVAVRFEMNSEQNGGTRFRATVLGQAEQPAMLLEMERTLIEIEEEEGQDGTATDSTPEKRWRNRVTLRTIERK